MIRFRDVTPSIENASGFFNFRQIEKAIKNDQWPSLQVTAVFAEGSPTAQPLSVENFLSASYDITTKNASFTLILNRIHYTSSTSTYPVMIGSTTSSFGFGQNTVVKLIVNTNINGAGGSAGAAGTTNGASGNNGGNGGPALFADYTLDANQTIIIENNGVILGGGGGGGGGGAGENSSLMYVVDSDTVYSIPNSSALNTTGTYTFWHHIYGISEPYRVSQAIWDGVTVGDNPNSDSTPYFADGSRWYIRRDLRSESGRNDYYAISWREYPVGSTTFGSGATGGAGGGYNSTGNDGGTGVNGLIPINGGTESSSLCAGGNGGAGGAPGEDGEDGASGRLAVYTFQGSQPTGGPSYSFTAEIDNGGTGGTAGVAITGINKITLINNGTVGTTI